MFYKRFFGCAGKAVWIPVKNKTPQKCVVANGFSGARKASEIGARRFQAFENERKVFDGDFGYRASDGNFGGGGIKL